MATAHAAEYALNISADERHELLRILNQLIDETHSERRRTEDFEYRAEVDKEYALLESLMKKVQDLESAQPSQAPAESGPSI